MCGAGSCCSCCLWLWTMCRVASCLRSQVTQWFRKLWRTRAHKHQRQCVSWRKIYFLILDLFLSFQIQYSTLCKAFAARCTYTRYMQPATLQIRLVSLTFCQTIILLFCVNISLLLLAPVYLCRHKFSFSSHITMRTNSKVCLVLIDVSKTNGSVSGRCSWISIRMPAKVFTKCVSVTIHVGINICIHPVKYEYVIQFTGDKKKFAASSTTWYALTSAMRM